MIAAREIQPFNARSVRGLSSASRRLFECWMKACVVRGNEVLAGLGVQATLAFESAVAKSTLDAIAGISDPDVAALVGVGPTSFSTVLSFKPGALLTVLHATMGVASTECPADRSLTPVEQSLAEMLYDQICREWSEAWPQREPLALTYKRSVTRTSRARIFDPAAILLATVFRLETTCGPQVVTWLIPLEEIELLCSPVEPTVAPKASGARISDVATLVPMPLSVELGRVQLSVLEAESLRCGDVLILDQTTRSPLTARVAGQPKYQGRPGRSGSKICFAIDGILEG
jgi:flagellar motor switch protein FliM